MGQALYRKYRSKKLSEIVGQEHITTTLTNALISGQMSHAYLFTGPRGVGKTSVARILAHEVNGIPYKEDDNHLDIIEIDAASNRKIDEIRQLRDRINLAPTSSKYKVYIIDEVHMLTREAFNALLKTLEEPPEHVIFILATTESYKVPETIISRTQQFNFRPISAGQMIGQLSKIAKNEKIEIDEDALSIIAEYGQGSFRDSIGLLDQVSSIGSRITSEKLESFLGMVPTKLINSLVSDINNASIRDLVKTFNVIYENGYNVAVVCKQLNQKLREQLINNKLVIDPDSALKLMKELIDVPSSNDPSGSFEIALIGAILENPNSEVIKKPKVEQTTPPKPSQEISNDFTDEVEEITVVEEAKIDKTLWPKVLEAIKKQHNTLYGIARMATPISTDGKIVLKTKFAFHARSLNEAKNKAIVGEITKKLTGKSLFIECIIDKDTVIDELAPDTVTASSPIEAISNIFGGAEVLE